MFLKLLIFGMPEIQNTNYLVQQLFQKEGFYDRMVLESVQSIHIAVWLCFCLFLNRNLFFDLFYQDLVKVFLGILEQNRNHDKI